MSLPEYKLSTVLHGHSLDVRCVAVTGDSCILSASRDKTSKLWHPEGAKDFVNTVTYEGHKNFVSCVCWVPPCESFPEGLVVTGSNDTNINCYNLQTGHLLLTLRGHENTVASISAGHRSGKILSGSWDCTGRVWDLNSPNNTAIILKGHQAAVWSNIELKNTNYATGSADKTIILWGQSGNKLITLNGHNDCVRDLVVLNESSFLSCANDATIKLWTYDGECLETYCGHPNYIYSVCVNVFSNNCIISSGEDGCILVWSGSKHTTINVPAQSVWSVACLHNGDIVAGSSDGVVRVFTQDPVRQADAETLKIYEEEVRKLQDANKQEIGGFKLSELPGPEVLFEPGKTDGQTKLVRRGTNVKCYSWNAANATWDEIGDVMGSAGPAEGKTMYEGKEYDFVFNVDIQEGLPPIKLPYNKSEDPWLAAQNFIYKHELPQVYLEQVANFIITNSGQTSSLQTNNGVGDPFTGGSRYIPSSPSNSLQTSTSLNNNPNTSNLIPHKSYIRFDQGNFGQILVKMKEFNSQTDIKLTEQELENVCKLGNLDANPSMEDIQNLQSLFQWPKDMLFPILDVTRLAVRHKVVNAKLFDSADGLKLVEFLLSLIGPGNLTANEMLALRIFVNAFTHLTGEMLVLASYEIILNKMLFLSNLNKNTQIAASSLLLNLSVALGDRQEAVMLTDVAMYLLPQLDDNEAYFRGLVALGTLLAEYPDKLKLKVKILANNQFHNKLKNDSESVNEGRINLCSRQIINLLQ